MSPPGEDRPDCCRIIGRMSPAADKADVIRVGKLVRNKLANPDAGWQSCRLADKHSLPAAKGRKHPRDAS